MSQAIAADGQGAFIVGGGPVREASVAKGWLDALCMSVMRKKETGTNGET